MLSSKKHKIYLFRVLAITIPLFFILFIAEIALFYTEKQHLDFADTFREDIGRGGFLKENFDDFVIGSYYGSQVRWRNNSAGFRSDREFTEKPAPGVLRILSIGDSFTAGYRVGQEETFSFLLEKWINSKYGKAEVLISSIEDPVTGFDYLQRFGYLYQPHILILGITLGNDIAQSYAKSVLKKSVSHPDLRKYNIPGQCLNRLGWIEKVTSMLAIMQRKSRILNLFLNQHNAIASSYGEYTHPKLFDQINGLGGYLKTPPPEMNEAYNQLFNVLLDYKAFSEKNGILFAAALFPQRFQIQPKDWENTIIAYRLKTSCFDIELPNTRIKKFCDENSIRCIDPTEAMIRKYNKSGRSLYFPRGDMHWNGFGHRVFFESIQDSFSGLIEQTLLGEQFSP